MIVEEYDAMIEKKYEDMINAWELEDAKKQRFEKGYKKGVDLPVCEVEKLIEEK